MIPISVCIIAKNEEKYIEGCLKHLQGYDWEVVVVDTGSSDQTVEIAKKYTNSVYHYDWCDDFSKARNFAAKKAKNDIIFVIDADEYLSEAYPGEILELFKEHPYGMGDIEVANLLGDENSTSREYINVTRIYSKKYAHFEGRIHEQIRRLDGEKKAVARLHISAVHYGYLKDNNSDSSKDERNIKLLLMDLEEDPDNPYTYFQLSQSYAALGRTEDAHAVRAKAISLDPPMDAPYTERLLVGYGKSAMELGKYDEALSLEGLYDELSDVADYLFTLGQAYFATGDNDMAIRMFAEATEAPRQFIQGMNTYFPLNAMSVIYESIGDTARAKECSDMAQELVVHASSQFKSEISEI